MSISKMDYSEYLKQEKSLTFEEMQESHRELLNSIVGMQTQMNSISNYSQLRTATSPSVPDGPC